jgi:RHS repeat-associated protein
VVTNQAGAVVRRHDFKPFGEEINVTFPNPDRKLFAGQERDSETALDYFGPRYYRADLGRFTTIDPVYTWKENLVDSQRWRIGSERRPTRRRLALGVPGAPATDS